MATPPTGPVGLHKLAAPVPFKGDVQHHALHSLCDEEILVLRPATCRSGMTPVGRSDS